MALIKCPECGHEISDTVVQCPHCGYKIKKYVALYKYILLIGIGIIAIICIVLGIHKSKELVSDKADEVFDTVSRDYWDNNKWGTAYSEIKDKYKDKIFDSTLENGSLAMTEDNAMDIEGLYTMINYSFTETEKLCRVTIIYTNRSTKPDSEIISIIKNQLSEKLGSYVKEDSFYKWSTDNSDISLFSTDGGIVVAYESKDSSIWNEEGASEESKDSVKDLIALMYSYIVEKNAEVKESSYTIIGYGGRKFQGNINIGIKGEEVYWRYEDNEYFDKLYPIFEELYGEPDREHITDSVSWYEENYEILLQNNNGYTQIWIRK